MPAVVAGGLGLASGTSLLPLVDSYVDQKQEIEMHDMYFLWQAHERLPRT